MKRLIVLVIGLAFLSTTLVVAYGQAGSTDTKKKKKKKKNQQTDTKGPAK